MYVNSIVVLADGGFFALETPIQWLICAWIVFLGGCVGSFINVVVYRLPAGLSIVHPGSRCPHCEHPIRWHDNIPVLGWIMLRGRCRDCGAAISRRYPLVEALVGAVFAALLLIEVISHGANLPQRSIATNSPPDELVLWNTYAAHLLLVCTLICAALIRYDGHSVPLNLFMPVFVVVLILSLSCPPIHPVSVVQDDVQHDWSTGLADALAGLAVGAVLGGLALFGRRGIISQNDSPVVPLAACGIVLGWQAVSLLAAVSAVVVAVVAKNTRSLASLRAFPAAFLVIATMLLIAGWRRLNEAAPVLVAEANYFTLLGAAAVVLSVSSAERFRAPPATSSRSAEQKPSVPSTSRSKKRKRRGKR